MPYNKEHKAQTRARIVDAARRMFNRHGFEQVSIDQIMAEAGLTRGGFYYHFRSKDELYAAAVARFGEHNPHRQALQARGRMAPRELAWALVDVYLGDGVFGDLDNHCPLYALPGDVARAGEMPQRAYTQLVRGLLAVFEAALADEPDGAMRAQAVVSLCVGGMVLARTTDDGALRKTLRAASRRQALDLLGAG